MLLLVLVGTGAAAGAGAARLRHRGGCTLIRRVGRGGVESDRLTSTLELDSNGPVFALAATWDGMVGGVGPWTSEATRGNSPRKGAIHVCIAIDYNQSEFDQGQNRDWPWMYGIEGDHRQLIFLPARVALPVPPPFNAYWWPVYIAICSMQARAKLIAIGSQQVRHFMETGRWATAVGERILRTPFSHLPSGVSKF